MLMRLHIENLKLHGDTTLDTPQISVLIGPNNSGKSTTFQALLALRQAASLGKESMFGLPPQSQIIDLGEFKDAVRLGQDVIRLGVTGRIDEGNPFYPNVPMEISFALDVRNDTLSLHKGKITCLPAEIEWIWYSGQPHNRVSITVENSVFYFSTVSNFRLIGTSGYQSPGHTPADVDRLTRVGESLAASPARLLNSVHPVYPLRGFEEWGYPLSDAPADNIDIMTLRDRALAIASKLAYDRSLEKRLSERLEGLLKIGIAAELVPGRRVKIWAKPSAGKVPDTLFVNEGTGVSQLPFILIPIALTPRNETILLSEPEAHLHPKAQCDLTRMLLTVAKKENIQFFIETHSEHVLHVILNAVAKGEWTRDQVALIYFQNKQGTAEVSRREINQFGQVDGGLPDFFEQSLSELTEYLKALSKT